MNIARAVEPELLDGLPEDSVEARASRRDLRIINRTLGSAGWFRRMLHGQIRAGESVLEIGAGAGDLGFSLGIDAAKMAGLDLCRRPPQWPAQSRWFETDVMGFAGWEGFPIVIGSLFFHHFERAQLAALGANLNRHARVIIASEPLRVRRSQYLFFILCWLIRANSVTRHDGRISIAAGFRHEELACLLQLDVARWSWCVEETWLGACRLVARRRL